MVWAVGSVIEWRNFAWDTARMLDVLGLSANGR
jgi:hypothetical protein